MSDVFLCVVRGVINVNKFEVRLLLSSHLKKITFGMNNLGMNNNILKTVLTGYCIIQIFV